MNSSSPALAPASAAADAVSSSIEVRVVTAAPDIAWFDEQLAERHYLGAGCRIGDYLRQLVTVRGQPAALLVWGPACYALKDRDRWLGWSATHRTERLKLIVQNRRFLLLSDKGEAPNLASQTLAAALRELPEQWRQTFGYRPLLAESFTDPEAYAGTCYKASNWLPVGTSAGYSRHRADFYLPNERPKRLWLFPLDRDARRQLSAAQLPADCQPGIGASPSGVLPVPQPQVLSLFEVLQQAPDPRAKNTRFRIGAVLTLVVMGLLAGRRDIASLVRFARKLLPNQRRMIGLPRKKGTLAFYEVPSYTVFYSVLTRLDNEAFAAHIDQWLQTYAGTLPGALALDGKMIRDHIGLLTLAQHEDGAPQAIGVYDQKEGTERCEQTAAAALLKNIPTLDGKTVTADALHCQKSTARTIVEKGGEYLLQIKNNQPGLLAQAQAFDALPGAAFFFETAIGHGRVENRGLAAFAIEPTAANFPFARSVIVVRSEVTDKKTGETTHDTRYYLSSLEPAERTPRRWQALVRGHWGGVEIRNHWRRDAVWGEDRSRTRHATALANVAILRNALLALLPEAYPDTSLPEIHEELVEDRSASLRLLRAA